MQRAHPLTFLIPWEDCRTCYSIELFFFLSSSRIDTPFIQWLLIQKKTSREKERQNFEAGCIEVCLLKPFKLLRKESD